MPYSAVIATDSFKGTMTNAEAGEAIRSGLGSAECASTVLPAADGGEGTAEALRSALGGEVRTERALDPLGRELDAEFTLLETGDALIEVASASGLHRVSGEERDALAADSYGTGQLIAAAAREGVRRVLLAAGGSATTDGGAGALRALDDAGLRPEIEVLCDVRTPFELAPEVFGPQKGADVAEVAELRSRLDRFAEMAPRDPRGRPMTGAAGGLAGGLWASADASLRPGADFVLDAIGFDSVLAGHHAVLTGEGCLDETTLEGKLVYSVASRALRAGVHCHVLTGRCDLPASGIRRMGLASVCEAGSAAELTAAAHALAVVAFDPNADA